MVLQFFNIPLLTSPAAQGLKTPILQNHTKKSLSMRLFYVQIFLTKNILLNQSIEKLASATLGPDGCKASGPRREPEMKWYIKVKSTRGSQNFVRPPPPPSQRKIL